jgi:hypothetical protein
LVVSVSDLLFYRRPVALNRRSHARARVLPPDTFRFVAEVNAVVVVAMEFFEAARHYPIVFARGDDGQVLPVVVLGLHEGENLFVDEQGQWPVGYLPAFVRRFPFTLADTDSAGQFLVCVDGDYLDQDGGDGEDSAQACRLFDDQGRETPYLTNATAFMRQYNQQFEETVEFIGELDGLGLLTEMSAEIKLVDAQLPVTLANFMIIDEQALRGVPGDDVVRWFGGGQLAWIYAHLMSLGNFSALADRSADRSAERRLVDGSAALKVG